MSLTFLDYEIPLLKALKKLGGSSKTSEVYPVVEDIMNKVLKNHPEEYGHYKLKRDIIWKNKIRFAREYLKRKEQLDGSMKGVWRITRQGRERLRIIEKTNRDPDEGKAIFEGIDESIANVDRNPEKVFDILESLQDTGDILNFRGIVYEPINEQGVVLVLAAACKDLGFRLEGIRTKFPDALLRRRNKNGTFSKCAAELEFKSSNYKLHKHPIKGCDLIICWEHDWDECPIEVLELKEAIKKLNN